MTFNTFLKCAIDCNKFAEGEKFFNEIEEKDLITYSVYIKGLFYQS